MILDDKTIIMKIAPLKSIHSSIPIAIAWGDQFPRANKHIIAIFNVYLGLERDRFNKSVKARDVLLVLESVWTDDLLVSEEEHFLMTT